MKERLELSLIHQQYTKWLRYEFRLNAQFHQDGQEEVILARKKIVVKLQLQDRRSDECL